MKNRIAQAVAAAFALTLAGGVQAATTTTDSINPIGSTDSSTNGVYSSSGYPMGGLGSSGDFTANKYNGGQVLVGATFSAVLASEAVSFAKSGGGSNPSGDAFARSELAVGSTILTATGNSATISASNVGGGGVTGNITSYTVASSATSQSQLNSLYGTGTVAGTVKEALWVSRTGGGAGLSINNTSDRTASVDYTYQTVNHANGSFNSGSVDSNSLALSFGNVLAGSTPTGLAFSLYNLVSSFGLQVVSANYSGSSLFSLTGITGTSNLAAGSFAGGVVNMASTLAAGDYSGLWTFTVADSASGIGAGRNFAGTDTLTLAVNAHVAAVPEPGEWAMMLAGFGLIGFMANRRRRRNG